MKNSIAGKITFSNIITGILVLVIVAALFIPDFKANILKGLLKIGLFQPNVEDTPLKSYTDNASLFTEPVLFKNVYGKFFELNSLKGKVVFINFWATWCPPCIAEMPSINELYLRYNDNPNALFLIVDADSNFNLSQKFVADKKYNFPIVVSQSSVPKELFAGGLPTTVILNKKGRTVYRREGMSDYTDKEFYVFFEKLLEENQ